MFRHIYAKTKQSRHWAIYTAEMEKGPLYLAWQIKNRLNC